MRRSQLSAQILNRSATAFLYFFRMKGASRGAHHPQRQIDRTSHSADAFRYMAMAYKENVPEPPPKTVQWKFLHEATLDKLWEAQDRPRRRAWT